MKVEIPPLSEVSKFVESLQRNALGASLLILLILSVGLVVYVWRWAPLG
ncbi:hypothetical protein [Rhodoferax saidenbachensis]|nr:hypothetical protein [Rhodoferax saidenbachensis]